jgi:hypothetical protein
MFVYLFNPSNNDFDGVKLIDVGVRRLRSIEGKFQQQIEL